MTQDILITGGGLTGMSMALAAAQAGLSVTLIDQTPAQMPATTFDGRSYALAAASCRMLRVMGIWDRIADAAQPIQEVKASDGRPGHGASPWFLHFDRGELEEGPMGHMVEDRHLRPALLAALSGSGIDYRAGSTVVAQAAIGPQIEATLSSGESLKGGLLIGADGRQSGTATRSGIARRVTDYDQTALVCAVSHALPHDGIAHQFFMPGGPLAILPLRGNRASVVWSERADLARAYAALDDADFLAVLRPRFGDFLGEIALEGARWSYPLTLSQAARVVETRLALVGDAAQGVHPIAGQGLNQGLRDVASLAEVLAEARRRGEDIGTSLVLERYRQWRSFDRTALALATDGFNRLFSNDNPLLRLGRDIGLGAVTALPGLRRRLVREAAGLSGDLPRLLQGRPV